MYILLPSNVTCLSIEWNSMRLSDRAPQKVTKTVRKTVLRGGGGMVGCQYLSNLGHNLS